MLPFRNILTCRVCGPAFPVHLRTHSLILRPFDTECSAFDPIFLRFFTLLRHIYARIRTTYRNVHPILRSFGVYLDKSAYPQGNFTEFTYVCARTSTVCPILLFPGVKAHTSSHLPLATHPASAALTQHNVRCIEALSSQEDQAYRRRNRYTRHSLNVGQGCISDYELRKNSRRSSVSCAFLLFNFYTLSRKFSHVRCCCAHISKKKKRS